jgi:hypothetical protein
MKPHYFHTFHRSGSRNKRRSESRKSSEGGGGGVVVDFANGGHDGPAHETEIFINDASNVTDMNFSFSRMDTYTQVRKKTRPLKLKKKLYEFYAAPITKYYSHCVSISELQCWQLHN